MKAVFVGLCVFAAAALVAADLSVTVGTEVSLEPDQWDDKSKGVTKIAVTGDGTSSKTEVRIIRRSTFAFNDSEVWLCDDPACLKKDLVSLTESLSPNKFTFYMYYKGTNFDLDMVSYTIKACKNQCEEECPGECNGHGGCVSGLHVCICDTGLHNRGKDCISSGLDWFYLFIIIGCCVIAAIILLIVGIICCCCCCACCLCAAASDR